MKTLCILDTTNGYVDSSIPDVFKLEVIDYFVYDGVLKNCPDWVIEAVEEGLAVIMRKANNTLHIHAGCNGYHVADVGNLVIRTQGPFKNSFNVQVLHGTRNIPNPT